MATKTKFNDNAASASVSKKVEAIIALLDAAEQPGTTNAEKRDLLRKATVQNKALVTQLEKAARPKTVAYVGSQIPDIAKTDAGITQTLEGMEKPDAKRRQTIRKNMSAKIAEAREQLTAIGTPPASGTKDAAHQADEDWMRAGGAGFALAIAETRVAQDIFGETGKRPSYPAKAATRAARPAAASA